MTQTLANETRQKTRAAALQSIAQMARHYPDRDLDHEALADECHSLACDLARARPSPDVLADCLLAMLTKRFEEAPIEPMYPLWALEAAALTCGLIGPDETLKGKTKAVIDKAMRPQG